MNPKISKLRQVELLSKLEVKTKILIRICYVKLHFLKMISEDKFGAYV